MEITIINNENIWKVAEFIGMMTSEKTHFRYFSSRGLDAIGNHKMTVITKKDGNIVGYGHIDFDGNKHWLGLCVLEKFQRLGYGKLTLDFLVNHALNSDIELYLTVDNSNSRAYKIYEKAGFKCIEKYKTSTLMVIPSRCIRVPVSVGEAFDKLSILKIKMDNISDKRREDVLLEYDILKTSLHSYMNISSVTFYYNLLLSVNLCIWKLQENFRITDDKDKKDNICVKIIEENGRRFRIKSKLNSVLNSKLREQKGYARSKAFFLGHLGLGDNISCSPIVRYLSTIYDEVTVVCKEHNYANIIDLYSDDDTIKIYNVTDDYEISPLFWQGRNALSKLNGEYTIILSGHHNIHNPEIDVSVLPLCFYDQLGIDRSVITDYCFFPETDTLSLPEIPFVLLHSHTSYGPLFSVEDVEKKLKINRDEILIVDVNSNIYENGHKFFDQAQAFVGLKIFRYVSALKKCKILVLSDSSLFCIAIMTVPKREDFYYISRYNADYSHVTTARPLQFG
jgi:GNAT superfamily N-acetyltransferase